MREECEQFFAYALLTASCVKTEKQEHSCVCILWSYFYISSHFGLDAQILFVCLIY